MWRYLWNKEIQDTKRSFIFLSEIIVFLKRDKAREHTLDAIMDIFGPGKKGRERESGRNLFLSFHDTTLAERIKRSSPVRAYLYALFCSEINGIFVCPSRVF